MTTPFISPKPGYNTYLLGSREFQPIRITQMSQGVLTLVTDNVQYVIVPKGQSLSQGTPMSVVTLNGEIGFYTDFITQPGFYEVGARIIATPELPLLLCGFIRIK